MRYIDSPSNDAYFNMALEEYVFESLSRDESYFMLWQNANAVVVGKYQNTVEELDPQLVRQLDVAVVRRLSGGGAMYQDLGNLNFTFVVNQERAVDLDFSIFIEPVIGALRQMGVNAEYNSRNDIVIEGKKISGNAQYNKGGRTMHHGTMLFNSDLSMIGRVLWPSPDKIESKGVKSVRARVTNIADYLPPAVTLTQFKAALLTRMFAAGSLIPYELNEGDLAAVQELREQKYATWAWNYGRSPAYERRVERRYPFGKLTLLMDVSTGRICNLAMQGDFFGNGEINELTERLIGLELREDAVRAALASIDVGYYIAGMETRELASLIVD